MKFVFIRHGKTPGNLKRQYIGVTDQPLSEEGRCEIQSVRDQKLYPHPGGSVFVSPMIRCRQTAQVLFPDAEQIVVEEMREMNFGIFEAKNADDLKDCEIYRDWVERFCEGPIPEGESKEDFSERVCKAFEEVLETLAENAETPYTFVVHGGTIMAIMSRYGTPERLYHEWYVENGHGYICEYKDGQLHLLETI